MKKEMYPGDILLRRKGAIIHQGIAVNKYLVFHNTPEKGEHISTFEEFAGDSDVEVMTCPSEDPIQVLMNIGSALARPRNYNLVVNNCEHAVSRVARGNARSTQLVRWVFLGAVMALGFFLLARARARSRSSVP